MTDFKLNSAGRGLCCKGCGKQDNKLNTYDWLADIPGNEAETDLVEVQFKNTRKGYYHNTNGLDLKKGDIVAVESSPGHDIGTVTLTGRLVLLQIKKANIRNEADIKRIYRIAKPVDMEKYEEAKSKEHETMIRSRQIAKDLGLEMKIGDVEYQGDGNKAIFYYIADGRVDFRQLIKVLADAFKVRIEMKQIGARQEAGRIGGIGPCGRELCCATWMKSFSSVSTSAARFQDISLNPQKLAGQCAKLKCCMNYEVDTYVEAHKRLPSKEITLQTIEGEYFFFKADILSGMITYSSDKNMAANLVTISSRRAFEVLNMNRNGEKPDKLDNNASSNAPAKPMDLAEQDDLTRFDKRKNNKKKRGGKDKSRNAEPQENRPADSKAEANNRSANGEQQAERNNREERNNRDERRERNSHRDRGERRERPNRQAKQERQQEPQSGNANAPAEKADRPARPEKQERRENGGEGNNRHHDRNNRRHNNGHRPNNTPKDGNAQKNE